MALALTGPTGFVPVGGGGYCFVGRIRRSRHPAGFFALAQKGHPSGWPSALYDAWQFPTLAWGDPTLPSALRRFTSEFGMGSGGTTALQPPGKFRYQHTSAVCRCYLYQAENLSLSPKHLRRCKVKPHGSLVSVSSTYRYAYTPDLSTSSSSTFLQETYSLRENSSRGKFRA